ncbi:acyl-CoA dehydrogenase family protein [Streptomyces sp. GQFP]|uniref:acyl-CoA dehydrogenase family protein n=1 Tax=Streptomyces sp. GQFP TaxID=2907545 RepID=UPI001F2F734D|nr:acyl-CoA dehydrogenase family protein [Streptomyces sp. GQFP]UIX29345.1 acyl-CoA/acyl-ACP dehydrogenase [Streptomyces sp. GQFP]
MIATMTAEREELTRLVRRFLAERAPLSETRRFLDTGGFDPAVWERMGKELGLQGLSLPEEFGGAGYGTAELALVVEEMGRTLYNGPFFSTICLAATALLASGDTERHSALLTGLAAGEVTASLAFAEPGGPWDGATCSTRWERDEAGGYRLWGAKTLVVDGESADLLLVTAASAQDPSALSLFVLEGVASGVRRRMQPALDQTRGLAAVDLEAAPAMLVGELGGAGPVLRRTLQRAAVLLAAEQVGGARGCLDMAVEYAGARAQFGRAIGSFQAVKHRCADMLLDVETARSAVLYAVSVLDGADGRDGVDEYGDPAEAASLARAHCSEVFSRVASGNVQIHGGIGFTWEHDAHLYLKRAKSSEGLLGSPSEHRELLARSMNL